MPPWPASTKEGGPFRHAPVLSGDEVAALAAWVKSRAPRGDRKDAPAPRSWDSAWPLGRPDVVLSMPEPCPLAEDGDDEYRVFVIPTGLAEGRWVSAMDFRPGNPRVVRHAAAAVDASRLARLMDKADPGPGYRVFRGLGFRPTGALVGWSPGTPLFSAPERAALYLEPGCDIVLQVRYQRSGKPETDASVLGLYFAKGPVDKAVRGLVVRPTGGGGDERPAEAARGADAQRRVVGALTLDVDVHAASVTPVMDRFGKDFLLRAVAPDGSLRTLVSIERWDPNWEMTYRFVTPVALPKGTRVEMVAHVAGALSDRGNGGERLTTSRTAGRTYGEPCLAFLSVIHDAERRAVPEPAR